MEFMLTCFAAHFWDFTSLMDNIVTNSTFLKPYKFKEKNFLPSNYLSIFDFHSKIALNIVSLLFYKIILIINAHRFNLSSPNFTPFLASILNYFNGYSFGTVITISIFYCSFW